jgi:hypothetical protein
LAEWLWKECHSASRAFYANPESKLKVILKIRCTDAEAWLKTI